MNKHNELRDMMAMRQKYFDARDVYYSQYSDEELGSDDFIDYPEDSHVEQLRLDILELIDKHNKELSVEDILEALTSIGDAPSLLYDDNGNFAVGGDGTQNIDMFNDSKKDNDEANFHGTWWLKNKDWKHTIREAIEAYLTRDRI
jgi:hypothetical protein